MSFSENIDEVVARNENGLLGAHSTWGRVRLREVAEILNGYPFNSKQFSKASGVPLIRIRDIGKKDTDIKFVGEVPEGYWIYSDDILIGMDGDFNTSLWAGCPALLNQRVCKVTVDELSFSKQFLFYTLAGYLNAINDNTPSITVKHLSSRTVSDIPLPCPPLNEQKRIADKLDQTLTIVKRAKARLARVPEILKQFRQSVLAAATDGRLTADWREDHLIEETGSVLLQRIRQEHFLYWEKTRKTRGKRADTTENLAGYGAPEQVDASELIELPESWAWGTGAELVEPGADIVYGIVQPGPKLEKGVPYVRGMDIENGQILVNQLMKTSPGIAEKYSRSALAGGDILLGIIRATKVAVVPPELQGANITQGTARYRPSSVILTNFLANALAAPETQRWLHRHYRGIDMPGLNLADVRRVPIPLPPSAEQDEIVRRVETLFALADRIEARYKAVAEKVDKLTPALLAKAFRGELVPQDPNDEPAAVLLERIRAQRAAAPLAKTGRGKKARVAALTD